MNNFSEIRKAVSNFFLRKNIAHHDPFFITAQEGVQVWRVSFSDADEQYVHVREEGDKIIVSQEDISIAIIRPIKDMKIFCELCLNENKQAQALYMVTRDDLGDGKAMCHSHASLYSLKRLS